MAIASSSTSLPKSPDAAAAGTETLLCSRILSSKLYFDIPLSKVPMIYSSSYDIAFLRIEKLHPFDSTKWGWICQFLIKEMILDKNRVGAYGVLFEQSQEQSEHFNYCRDQFSECVEKHAYSTYDKFLKLQGGKDSTWPLCVRLNFLSGEAINFLEEIRVL